MDKTISTIKYFLYARKSSESEDRQVASIDSQIEELKTMIKKENLKIVDIISESRSAKEPGRPFFNKMVERIYAGEANGIICWKLDRLARNPVDGGNINWMLQNGNIQHIKTHERSYYPTDNVLLMSFEFGMANQFIRDLRENTKRGLKTKAERGWYPEGTPLGYTHNPLKKKGEKEIINDEERFNTVKRAWDLMLTGNYNPTKIVQIATKEWGLTNKKGKPISRSTMYYIFSNPFYYGTFEYPKHSGNWHNGLHDPMITEEEFIRVQTILKRKILFKQKTHEFPFRGPISCGECGAAITAEEKIKKQKNGNIHHYVYYHCTKRKNPNCSQKPIETNKLEIQIVKLLQQIEIPESFHEWALRQLDEYVKQNGSERNQILVNQQKSYNKCLEEIDGIIGMRARGELDEENYKRKMTELTEQKVKLHELLQDTDHNVEQGIKNANKWFDFAKTAKVSFENGDIETKQQILTALGSNLSLKDQKINVELTKPLIFISEMSKEVTKINNNVRTSKKVVNKRTLEDLYSQSPILLRG